MSEDAQAKAADLLASYMRTVFKAAGLPWGSSDMVEIDTIVDRIIAATEPPAGAAQVRRYVTTADGTYREIAVTLVPDSTGAVVYDSAYGRMLDGTRRDAAEYVAGREKELLRDGWARLYEAKAGA